MPCYLATFTHVAQRSLLTYVLTFTQWKVVGDVMASMFLDLSVRIIRVFLKVKLPLNFLNRHIHLRSGPLQNKLSDLSASIAAFYC